MKNTYLILLSIALAISLNFNAKQAKLVKIMDHESYKLKSDLENVVYQLNMCRLLYESN